MTDREGKPNMNSFPLDTPAIKTEHLYSCMCIFLLYKKRKRGNLFSYKDQLIAGVVEQMSGGVVTGRVGLDPNPHM